MMTAHPLPDVRRPKVLVVDDDESQRTLLHYWLLHTGYEPCLAADGIEALEWVRRDAFDAVVTDLHMPRMNGLQLLGLLQDIAPALPVIFFTGQGTMEDSIAALREGKAFDFLQKPLRDLGVLNATIDRARARRSMAPPPAAPAPALPQHLEPLTAQERRLVSLLARGWDNRTIADALHFSEKTIRNYLSRVYDKLGVSSRLQAVMLCQDHGLIAREEVVA